jgi:hypothetical protein
MATIGNSTTVVTLTQALRNVTVTGDVDAFGAVGAYVIDIDSLTASHTFDAAIFGPAGSTVFTIVNDGLITSSGSSPYGAGIVLGDGGTVSNAGTITAGDGIAIFGTAGAEVINTKLIDATLGFGVYLHADGQVQNKGELLAARLGIALGDGGQVTNSGTIDITQRNGAGIAIYGGKADYVHNTGLIETGIFGYTGILVTGAGAVVNAGTIDGEYGIRLFASGTVTNTGKIFGGEGDAIELAKGGTIDNSGYLNAAIGIRVIGGAGRVDNIGTVHGEGGIYLSDGGIVTNSGSIDAINGINLTGGEAINSGLISVSNYGVIMQGGSPTLDNTGRILAGADGVLVAAGGTIIDTGFIEASHYAISFASNAANRLVISPTASVSGTVQLNGGALEFAAGGKTVGTFTPESLQFLNAGSITIDTGAIWEIAGTFTNGTDGILINDGTLKEGATGEVSFNGPIEGTGLIELGPKPLTVKSTVAATQKLEFTGTGETLAVGDAQHFEAKIEKFKLGDTIDLTGVARGAITGTHFAKGVLTLDEAAGSLTLTFASPDSFGKDVFVLTAEGAGTAITLAKPALLAPATAATGSALPDLASVYAATSSHSNPASLSGPTMSVPAGIAAYLLDQRPTALPAVTLQSA